MYKQALWTTLILGVFTLTFIFPNIVQAQCPTEDIYLNTQSEVDAFRQNYPNCTEIIGNLGISIATGAIDSIVNLDSLQFVTRVGKSLLIADPVTGLLSRIPDMSGLRNIIEIGDDLFLRNHDGLNLVGFENLERIGRGLVVNNCVATDFTGLANLQFIDGGLTVRKSEFENFNGLNTLQSIGGMLTIDESIIKESMGIPSLESIGDGITVTQCCFKDFEGMSNLRSIGPRGIRVADFLFSCTEGASLAGFTALDSLSDLQLDNTLLTDFGDFASLTYISNGIDLEDNNVLTDISGLMHLQKIGGTLSVVRTGVLSSLNGLDNLEDMSGGFAFISDNYSLIDITALRSLDFSTITGFGLFNNFELELCDNFNLCEYLANGQGNIDANGSIGGGCFDRDEVLLNCIDNFSKVGYEVFYDLNQNKIQDPDERLFPGASVLIEPTGRVHYSQSNAGGVIFLDPGTYNISFNAAAHPNWDVTTDSLSFQLEIDSTSSCDDLAYGVVPNTLISEVVTSLGGIFPRCNLPNRLKAEVTNLGTTIVDGTLWLELDEEIDSIEFFNAIDTFVAPNRYGWHFSDLFPGYSFSAETFIEIPGPPDFPVGDSLRFNTYADYTDDLGSQQSPEQNIQVEMRCSYDPNDKLVNPAREGDWTLFEETLTYTIRFQNTGNDVAYDVQIRDTLDPNLDPATLQVLSTSHPLKLNTSLTDSRFLVFDFPRIFLPDSASNPVGSQGFVTFQIDAVDGLPESTPILNRAGIYFDANPPIITNYTRNLMVSELPTVGFRPSPAVELLQVIPNPTQQEVYLLGTNVS